MFCRAYKISTYKSFSAPTEKINNHSAFFCLFCCLLLQTIFFSLNPGNANLKMRTGHNLHKRKSKGMVPLSPWVSKLSKVIGIFIFQKKKSKKLGGWYYMNKKKYISERWKYEGKPYFRGKKNNLRVGKSLCKRSDEVNPLQPRRAQRGGEGGHFQ